MNEKYYQRYIKDLNLRVDNLTFERDEKQLKIEHLEQALLDIKIYIGTHQLFKYIYDEEELFEIITDKEVKKDLLDIVNKAIGSDSNE